MAYSTGTGYANGIPSAFRVATTENYVNTLNVHMPEVAEDFVNSLQKLGGKHQLEDFENVDYSLLLEDFRQPVIRLEDSEVGDLVTEDDEQFALEEFVSEAVILLLCGLAPGKSIVKQIT